MANHLEDKEQGKTLATNQVEEQAEHPTHDVTVLHNDVDTLSGANHVEEEERKTENINLEKIGSMEQVPGELTLTTPEEKIPFWKKRLKVLILQMH